MIFLYKPHVIGAKRQITSPDVIVDQAFVNGASLPLGLLTMDAWFETVDDAQAGYALMALGGGALLLPAVTLANGTVSLGRVAWRLNALSNNAADVTLNGAKVTEIAAPSDVIAEAGGSGDALPRGTLVVQSGPSAATAVLRHGTDEIKHHVQVFADHWGSDRPSPRYSVGPTQKDVTHYI